MSDHIAIADQDLRDDLARRGLVVTAIERTPRHFIVACRDARVLPRVAVVDRSQHEHTEAFLRLMVKSMGHNGEGGF